MSGGAQRDCCPAVTRYVRQVGDGPPARVGVSDPRRGSLCFVGLGTDSAALRGSSAPRERAAKSGDEPTYHRQNGEATWLNLPGRVDLRELRLRRLAVGVSRADVDVIVLGFAQWETRRDGPSQRALYGE